MISLPFARHFAHKQFMNEDSRPPGPFKRLLRWAARPPQAYVVYLLALLLVWFVSFYAGSMNPKRAAGPGPVPPVSAPRN